MQRPTCTDMRVRNSADAHVIFHAVALDLLPMVSRRLDTDERRYIQSGWVFVWEERGPNNETSGIGIERWTDSIRWGPSRVKDEFLFYNERDPSSDSSTSPVNTTRPRRQKLVKQTYSVFVETPRGQRKWHLIAYFTQESVDQLSTVDDDPRLAVLNVPPGKYRTARSGTVRRTQHYGFDHNAGYQPLIPVIYDCLPHERPYQHTIALTPYTRPSARLAPLEYLKLIPPPRRHPLDEEALMSFVKSPAWIK